uniref:Uncharacterized protein n=1 Tax=Anguilla anguilla TaxID=7936 RepID=A0A0E9UF78_ANGAN
MRKWGSCVGMEVEAPVLGFLSQSWSCWKTGSCTFHFYGL